MLKPEELILEWNVDHSFQDGYLHTGSFPLSLAGDSFVNERRNNPNHLIFILDNFPRKIIVAIPRTKYPGELRSISKKSNDAEILIPLLKKYPFLDDAEPVGFHTLYGPLLGLIKDNNREKIFIRVGLKIKLYSTNDPDIFILKSTDVGSTNWRPYRRLTDVIQKEEIDSVEEDEIKETVTLSEAQLLEKINNRKTKPVKLNVLSKQFKRDQYVTRYALKRSGGTCDLCSAQAPFLKENEEPYLEVHHIIPLSKGGTDSPDNVVALCPNCHRKLHHSKNKEQEKDILIKKMT